MKRTVYGLATLVLSRSVTQRVCHGFAKRTFHANTQAPVRRLHQSAAWQSRKPPSTVVNASRHRKGIPGHGKEPRSESKSATTPTPPIKGRTVPKPASLLLPSSRQDSSQTESEDTGTASSANVRSTTNGTGVPTASASRASDAPAIGRTISVRGEATRTATSSELNRISRYQKRTDDYWTTLAKVAAPVVIYKAPSHTQLKLIAAGSLISCVSIAKFTFGPYAQFAGSNTLILAGGGLVTGFWLFMGTYLFSAPQKLIRSITAVPEKTALANPTAGPVLQVEMEPSLPGLKPKIITVPAFDLSRDASIERHVHSLLLARQEEKLRFHWGKAFFQRVRSILFDTITLFTRKSFVYVKLPGRAGSGKIELPGAVNYDRGRALEQVLQLDESKKTWFRKMFFSDPRWNR